jgi:UDP-N-acetylmuramoyl-L-alanyl-D-glutamate--2,6-diaminopimelate ligase
LNQPARPVSLKELFQDFPIRVFTPVPHGSVTGIAIDSRQVRPGDLFVAVSGGTTDGHRYIAGALERGAAAVVGEKPLAGLAIPYIQVESSRQAVTHLAATIFGFPARKLVVIGVTGTDGKTTTINLIYQILKAEGLAVGMVSTVNAVIGDEVLDTGFHVTTPDAHDLQRYMARMRSAGLTHAILETTSHGLAQHRVDACEFDVACVTNITHEHLDEHGSYEAYRAAKARLFMLLDRAAPKQSPTPRVGVLNRDDASFDYLSGVTRSPILSYGLSPEAVVRGREVVHSPSGLRMVVECRKSSFPIQARLVGNFNVANCLAAIAVTVEALGVNPQAAQEALAAFEGVPGRMEPIDLGQAFTAVIDFAHTPHALRCALETARKMSGEAGRVIAVFGSAGLRDREKRRLMAEVAAQWSDLAILTAEDPRTESLEAILAEMARGMEAQGGVEGRTFWRIPDRGEAIRYAISMARPGDIVLACGKGHEQSMCFGTTEYPWDDRLALRAALSELLGATGPEMPYLPTQSGTIQT